MALPRGSTLQQAQASFFPQHHHHHPSAAGGQVSTTLSRASFPMPPSAKSPSMPEPSSDQAANRGDDSSMDGDELPPPSRPHASSEGSASVAAASLIAGAPSSFKPTLSIVPRVPAKLQVIHSYKKVRYKKTLHRVGAPTWKLPLFPNTSSTPTYSTTLTDYLLQGAPADKPLPPRNDWARLAYGTFIDHGQKNDEQEWGPSVRGVSQEPVISYLQGRHRREVTEEHEREVRIRQLEERLVVAGKGKGKGEGKVEDARQRDELVDLKASRLQRQLWARLVGLVRAEQQASGGGVGPAAAAGARLIEAPNFRARTKLQSKNDIKKFEKEKRKKQSDKEEARKRRLRHYLQKVLTHREDFMRFHRTRRVDVKNCALGVKKFLESRDKRMEREKENEEKMRLQALKTNNMDEYIRLVSETRNQRLSYLIQQTDAYIGKIGDLVQAERLKATGGVDYEAEEPPPGGGGEETELGQGMSTQARNYYLNTHRKAEEVVQPSLLKGGDLKEYQIAGLQWMVSLYNNHLSGILADEMGLGKTIQSISLIAYVMEVKHNLGPFLIVVPLSTMSNWVNEFKKWAPDIILVQYKGTPDDRRQIFRDEMEAGQFNVVLTTYDYVMKDKAVLRRFTWEYIIVDEGHRMKNTESKFAQTLGSYYTSKRRLLLTGTPLQNNLPELWSLLNFLLPSIFNSPDTFDQWFNKPFASFGGGEEAALNEEEKMLIIQRLHELLRPFMLRRVKSAVMGQLPTKVEKVLKCELSAYQRMLYKDITSKCLKAKVPGMALSNMMMHLRKCCNHPFLFQDSYTIDRGLMAYSGKLELLDRILPKLKAAGHRVLLFSQMTQVLDILEDYFRFRDFRYLRLDGQTVADDREQRMYQFNAPDSPYFIFALSTRAGGLGLNLATADTVIFYDSDWNPSMDSQAMDRAHRIGQKNDVRVFRLITNTSVEEKIISRANEKSKLTNLVVEAGKFNRDSKDGDRRAMVESLLRDVGELEGGGEGGGAEEEDTVPDDDQLNDMMATSKEELELYRSMDEERRQREAEEWEAYVEERGLDLADHPQPSRLAQDIPADAVTAIVPSSQTEESEVYEDFGGGLVMKGPRKRKDVTYADNLTEKQFLRMMETKAQEEEKAKVEAKKQRQKDKPPPPALQPEVYGAMMKVMDSIKNLKSSDGREVAAIFLVKPPKKDYKDYYQVIKNPIDLKTIRHKIKSQEYRSIDAFEADCRLLVKNAMTYNEEGSVVYEDASLMLDTFDVGLHTLRQKCGTVGGAANKKVKNAIAVMKRGPGRPRKQSQLLDGMVALDDSDDEDEY